MQKGFIRLDFNFILAIIALVASAVSLNFQFQEAGYEYESLSNSMSPLVRSRNNSANINETIRLNQELDELEHQLEMLDMNQ